MNSRRILHALNIPLLFLASLLVVAGARAQERPGYRWVAHGDTTMPGRSGSILAVAATGDAALMAGGVIFDSTSIGGVAVRGRGGTGFIARYAGNGSLQWIRTASSGGSDSIVAVAVDSSGNCYAAGTVDMLNNDVITVDTKRLDSGGCFVAKFSPAGELLWARALGEDTRATSIAVSPDGNVLLAGACSSPRVLGPDTIAPAHAGASHTSWLPFLAWITPAGAITHALRVQGAGSGAVNSVAFDRSGALLVTGGSWFYDQRDDTTLFGRHVPINSQMYVARLGPNGGLLWLRTYSTGYSGLVGTSVAAGPDGGAVAAGMFGYEVGHDADTLHGDGLALQLIGALDIVVLALDSNGAPRWEHLLGGRGSDEPGGIAIDARGGVFLSACFDQVAVVDSTTLCADGRRGGMVAAFSSEGRLQWWKVMDGDYQFAECLPHALALGVAGDVVIAGECVNGIRFDKFDVPPSERPILYSRNDMFLARLGGPEDPRPAEWTPALDRLPINNQSGLDVVSLATFNGGLYAGQGVRSGRPYAGAGVFFSSDHGARWRQIDSTSEDVRSMAPRGDSLLYSAGYFTSGLFYLTPAGTYGSITSIAADRIYRVGTRLFAATADTMSLYYSDDGGRTWNAPDDITLRDYGIWAMATDGSTIIAGGNSGDSHVFRSTDGGRTWAVSEQGASPGYQGRNGTSRIRAMVAVGDHVYAGFDWSNVARSGGVYVTSDGGITWSPQSDGLPTSQDDTSGYVVSTNDLHVIDGALAAATDSGVWLLPRGASRWVNLTGNLYAQRVNALAHDDRYLYAVLEGYGVWRRELNSLSLGVARGDLMTAGAQLAVQPNPLGGAGRIILDVPHAQHGAITLYDVLGRSLRMISSGPFPGGSTSITFDGADLPAGVYLLRFVSESGDAATARFVRQCDSR